MIRWNTMKGAEIILATMLSIRTDQHMARDHNNHNNDYQIHDNNSHENNGNDNDHDDDCHRSNDASSFS